LQPKSSRQAFTGFVSRFMGRIGGTPSIDSRFIGRIAAGVRNTDDALPPVSRFMTPVPAITPYPRRLRSLWKSKHFLRPVK
jgi:hypothetical protein